MEKYYKYLVIALVVLSAVVHIFNAVVDMIHASKTDEVDPTIKKGLFWTAGIISLVVGLVHGLVVYLVWKM